MTTIIDVAEKAGVSFKTVSRVLNGEANVRDKTRDKVLAAAKALDYRVNHSARSLRSGAPTLVGLVFDNPSRAYSHDLQLGAMTGCQDAGFGLITQSDMSHEALKEFTSQAGLTGVVLGAPQADQTDLVSTLLDRDLPVIRIATQKPIDGTHHVSIDERSAARAATDHLLNLGHRRIAIINGPDDQHMSTLRFEGFEAALHQHGLTCDPRFTRQGQFDFESGLSIAEDYLNEPDRPSAIFAANDDMAAGCLAAAYKLGIRVPDELSIIGFDDSPAASIVYPSLTTIRQSTAEMAQYGVGLLERIRRGDLPATNAHIRPFELIERQSCAAPQPDGG